MEFLKITDLEKSFGGLEVLKGINMEIKENTLTGLIGPNGCGKSTLFNIISGVIPADSGSIKFQGKEILKMQPNKINKLGISRTYQETRLFPELTVLENLMLPPKHQFGENFVNLFLTRWRVKSQEDDLIVKAMDILELLEIKHMAYEYTKNLSGGQSKLADLGRVLMSDPKFLLLDEPTAGVNPVLTEKLVNKIIEFRDDFNLTILLIEHDMDVIMRKEVDHIYVVNAGIVVAEGTADEIQQDKNVIEAYLGR